MVFDRLLLLVLLSWNVSCSDCVPVFSRQALTLLWSHYVKELATLSSVPDYVLTVYHTRLVTVPWKGFFPDMDAIEMMVKVRSVLLISGMWSVKTEECAGKCVREMYGLDLFILHVLLLPHLLARRRQSLCRQEGPLRRDFCSLWAGEGWIQLS